MRWRRWQSGCVAWTLTSRGRMGAVKKRVSENRTRVQRRGSQLFFCCVWPCACECSCECSCSCEWECEWSIVGPTLSNRKRFAVGIRTFFPSLISLSRTRLLQPRHALHALSLSGIESLRALHQHFALRRRQRLEARGQRHQTVGRCAGIWKLQQDARPDGRASSLTRNRHACAALLTLQSYGTTQWLWRAHAPRAAGAASSSALPPPHQTRAARPHPRHSRPNQSRHAHSRLASTLVSHGLSVSSSRRAPVSRLAWPASTRSIAPTAAVPAQALALVLDEVMWRAARRTCCISPRTQGCSNCTRSKPNQNCRRSRPPWASLR